MAFTRWGGARSDSEFQKQRCPSSSVTRICLAEPRKTATLLPSSLSEMVVGPRTNPNAVRASSIFFKCSLTPTSQFVYNESRKADVRTKSGCHHGKKMSTKSFVRGHAAVASVNKSRRRPDLARRIRRLDIRKRGKNVNEAKHMRKWLRKNGIHLDSPMTVPELAIDE